MPVFERDACGIAKATHYLLVCSRFRFAVLPFSGQVLSPQDCQALGLPPGSVVLEGVNTKAANPQQQQQQQQQQPQTLAQVTTSTRTSQAQPQPQVSWVYLCASASCARVSSADGVRVANHATVTWWPRKVVRFNTHAMLVQQTAGPIARAAIGASFIQRGGKVQCPQLSVLASAFPTGSHRNERECQLCGCSSPASSPLCACSSPASCKMLRLIFDLPHAVPPPTARHQPPGLASTTATPLPLALRPPRRVCRCNIV